MMINTIKEKLRIGDKAIVLIPFIMFTFTTSEELDEMINACKDKSLKDINKYVYDRRRTKIASRVYSIDSFTKECQQNKHKALETLFQEPLSKLKYEKLANVDPTHIHAIHSKQPADIRYMKFLLYV